MTVSCGFFLPQTLRISIFITQGPEQRSNNLSGCVNPSSDGVSGQYFLGDGTNINLSYSAACHSDEQPSDPGPGMGSCVADS